MHKAFLTRLQPRPRPRPRRDVRDYEIKKDMRESNFFNATKGILCILLLSLLLTRTADSEH